MRIFRRIVFIVACIGFLSACNDDTVPFNLSPDLTADEATDIYRRGATIRGSIQKRNEQSVVERCGIYVANNPALSNADSITFNFASLPNGSFTQVLSGLEPGNTYYYATFACSGHTTVLSTVRNFTTLTAQEPVIKKPQVSNIGQHSFDISTEIIDDGDIQITSRGFQVYEEPEEGNEARDFSAGTVSGLTFSSTINDGIKPGTTYAVRAFAVGAYAGSTFTGYSDTIHVTTAPLFVPALTALTAYSTDAAGTLFVAAGVTSDGTKTATEWGFVYSTDTEEPVIESHNIVVGQGAKGAFTATLTNLSADRPVHVRSYATSEDGTGYGPTFTYNATDFPTLTTQAATNILEFSAQLNSARQERNSQISECGFLWSDSNTLPMLADVGAGVTKLTASAANPMTAQLNGLQGYHKYYFRPYARHAKGITYGAVREFTTLLVEQAVLSSTTVTEDSYVSARLSASVTELKNGTLTATGFVYSTSENPTVGGAGCTVIPLGTATSLSTEWTQFASGTTYHVRAFATNEKGTSYGSSATFTTRERENNIDVDGYEDDDRID